MDVIAGERGAQKPSSDRKEESRLDLKVSGTSIYGNMEDNMFIVLILKEIQSGLK